MTVYYRLRHHRTFKCNRVGRSYNWCNLCSELRFMVYTSAAVIVLAQALLLWDIVNIVLWCCSR